jgi:hypothetical protein
MYNQWVMAMNSRNFRFGNPAGLNSVRRAAILSVIVLFAWNIGWAQMAMVSGNMGLATNHVSGYLGSGVSFADFNGDGWDDLTFGHHGGNLRFYQGNGVGFEPVVIELGLGNAEVKGVLWVDIDNDNDQDLFVAVRLGPNRMFINTGNLVFEDVSSTCGIGQTNTRAYGACFGDYDADGFLDLFIANYNYNYTVDYPHNELYRNNGDGTFENVTFSSGDIEEVTIQNFQGHWVDWDDDGVLELYVIRDRNIFQNLYYKQVEPGTFEEVAFEMGVAVAINAMSTTVGDFDRDGDLDLYVTGGQEGNVLLRNDGGIFTSITDLTPYQAARVNDLCWAANWLDIDNDGWLDLHVAVGTTDYTEYPATLNLNPLKHSRMLSNSGDGFVDATDTHPEGNSLSFATATGDFNNDGFADLVSHKIGTHATLMAGVPNENHWLKVRPTGVVSNRDGIGVRMWCWTDGEVMMRMTFCGENYLGQNSRWQIFGLGAHALVDSLVVKYPSGIEDRYYNIPGETILTLIEGETAGGGGPFPSTFVVAGCTYPTACNYSIAAQTDNGTCDFSCLLASNCGPGTHYDALTMQCLPDTSCAGDLNGDTFVSIQDLLLLLADFGTECE